MERFVSNEDGQGMVEYSLIILLVVLLLVGAVSLIGNNTAAFFTNFASNF
jgi:pilus assembly protein Flp/PilA